MAEELERYEKVAEGQSVLSLVGAREIELGQALEAAKKEGEARIEAAKKKAAVMIQEGRDRIASEKKSRAEKIVKDATSETAQIRKEGEAKLAALEKRMKARIDKAADIAVKAILPEGFSLEKEG